MSINLIDLFNSTLSDVLVKQASTMLDESVESTSSAVSKIFPALLSAVLIKGSTDNGARDLLDYMSANRIDDALHEDVPSLLSGGPETDKLTTDGAGILKYLLGDKQSYMVDWVSSGNGLKTSSASTLLKIIAPLVMGAIARAVKEKNLDASGLKDLLQSQQPFVDASAPAAITELLGVHPAEPDKMVRGTLEGSLPAAPEKESSTMSKLLPWMVLLIAALGLFYFLEKGGGPSPANMEKMKMDSLDKVRRMDSIRTQTLIDSMGDVKKMDSMRKANLLDTTKVDSLDN